MNAQEQQVFEFSQEMNAQEQQVQSSQQVASTTFLQTTTSYQEPHVLDRPTHINLLTPFEQLEVLCELMVDFENIKDNNMDLTPELKHQGWLMYFKRLYGPI